VGEGANLNRGGASIGLFPERGNNDVTDFSAVENKRVRNAVDLDDDLAENAFEEQYSNEN
jgi:hypothetical protein